MSVEVLVVMSVEKWVEPMVARKAVRMADTKAVM